MMRPRRHATVTVVFAPGGAAMVFVLILLLVISMIGVSLIRAVTAQHRQRLRDEIRAQTVRLAEAGWNRAHRQRQQHPDYSGEVWRLSADELGPERTAEVRIELLPDAANATEKSLRVTAEFPVDSPFVTRLTLEGPIGE